MAAVRAEVANACAERLGQRHPAFTLEAAAERQHAGQLEFHDLLVLARALLRHPDHGPSVRASLHDRYRHLLLDEFQDTDPIQIELAVRIAAADPGGTDAGAPVVGRGGGGTGSAVHRGRPQAVHLPLPPGRHRHLPGRRRSFQHRVSAARSS